MAAHTIEAQRDDFSISLGELSAACAERAIELLRERKPQRRFWLFAAHGPWQPDNRIVRHKKLWTAFESMLSQPGASRASEEVAFTSAEGVRFAGVVEVTERALLEAIQVARTSQSCTLIWSEREDIDSPTAMQSLFRCAFPEAKGTASANLNWLELLRQLVPLGDAVLRVTGNFDDRDAAVDIIGSPDLIASLTE